MAKLSDGVLRVMTPLGLRYIKPTFWQRVYLVWIFRHFDVLPQQVLSRREQKLIDSLCASHDFISVRPGNRWDGVPIIGTVERRLPAMVQEPVSRPAAESVPESAPTPLADQRGS